MSDVSTNDSQKLRECPFCPDGGDPKYITGGSMAHAVRCGKCLVIGPIRHTEAKAIEAWNTRHERTCSPVEPFDSKTKHIVERGSNHYYWPYKGCPECQCDYPQGSKFCPNCGAKVVGE